jgi:succinate dehydrogenase/fumarate reductase flavoprotein subunit
MFLCGEIKLDHGANRLGASALMQGLADGYFVLPYNGNYLSPILKWELYLLILQNLKLQKKGKTKLKFMNNNGTFC